MKDKINTFLDTHEQEERKIFSNPRASMEDEEDETAETFSDERAAYGGNYDELVESGLHPNLAAQLSRMTPRQKVGWTVF
jgi:hypothetical protein